MTASGRRAERLVVTDLDGTLLDGGSRLSAGNRATLQRLGGDGTVRVVATGRNLYSARKAIAPDFPIDYLIFSSGAGIVSWPDGRILEAHEMPAQEARLAATVLIELELDFMVHAPVPDNHHFVYRRGPRANPDFERRLERYAEFARPWPVSDSARPESGEHEGTSPASASQLLAIEPAGSATRQGEVERRLPQASVIRTTSPLDHRSRWIEIFPAGVGKAAAAEWLRRRTGVGREHVLAVGNDWNDSDLLTWAASSFVTANAPAELRRRYPVVASHDEDGFRAAVERWLGG